MYKPRAKVMGECKF